MVKIDVREYIVNDLWTVNRLTDLGVRRTAADIDPFWRELKVIFV
jgi:hypothetical protein